MSFSRKVKTYIVVPKSLFSFRSPDPNQTIAAGLRRQRPILLSWFVLSCVAGALADAKRRKHNNQALAERKLRLLEELISDERDGRPGDRDETRRRLRAVGLAKRDDMERWEREQRELERLEAERRAKLGFWKRYFGSGRSEADQETEADLKMDDLAALTREASSTSASPSAAEAPKLSAASAVAREASPDVSFRPASSSSSTTPAVAAPKRKVELVPAEQRADWAKRNFV